MTNDAVIGLAEGIEALRLELMVAAERGLDQKMRFSIEPVELTVQIAVTKDASGGIGWKILGVSGQYDKVVTQTLSLKLTPLWTQPDGGLTSDFAISSPAFPGDTVGPHQ